MTILVNLTESIINRSLRLHYAHAPAKQRFSILYVPAALAFIAVYLFFKTPAGKSTANIGLGATYILLAVGYYFFMGYRREHTGKQLLKSLAENSRFSMNVNEHDLVTQLQETSLTQQWSAFPKAIISKELVLLYQPNSSFSMFDKSFFSGGDFVEFKDLVKDRVSDIKEV